MCGRDTWCLVKFYIILTAKKMPLWFVAVENKTFALWKWKAFPCLQGVLCQTLSVKENLWHCQRRGSHSDCSPYSCLLLTTFCYLFDLEDLGNIPVKRHIRFLNNTIVSVFSTEFLLQLPSLLCYWWCFQIEVGHQMPL